MAETQHSILDPTVLRALLRQLEFTDIDELEVHHGSTRLYLRREPGAGTLSASTDAQTVSARSTGASSRSRDGVPVMAPLTGVLYARPSPDAPPYVAVGDRVEAGQVVALIETMKLFNEVISESSGEIVSIEHHDGDLVEVGQALMYLRPHVESEEA